MKQQHKTKELTKTQQFVQVAVTMELVVRLILAIVLELVTLMLPVQLVSETQQHCTLTQLLAVCTSACENGGSCIGPETCDCSVTGYTDATCSTRK